jgi:hypothetical protein
MTASDDRYDDRPDGRSDVGSSEAREQELAARLAAVRDRIEAACRGSGRDPSAVTLVVVTKTYPADDVLRLVRLGVQDVGESRDQEATEKVAAVLQALGADVAGPTWHFIGRLQSNKARSVARYAGLVHSVDRPGLVAALGAGARAAGRAVACLVQVSLDADPARGGAPAEDVPELADRVAAEEGLLLRGIMAVAPAAADPDEAFAALPALRERLLDRHPAADVISAGMSGDLEAALRGGATHLRVGSAILGARPPLR